MMVHRTTTAVCAVTALVLLAGAGPARNRVPDQMLGQIIAGARAAAPAAIAFERQSHTVSHGSAGDPGSHLRVDRWDGRTFTLLSVDGKPPEAKEIDAFRKAAASRPVPGYHRIADLLNAGAVRQADAQGRIVYRVAALPKGSISLGKDVSGNVSGEFLVDASGAQPYVTRSRLVLTKPISFFLVAKLDSLEIVNDYRLDSTGRPFLARAVQAISGAQFGKQGSTRIESNYIILR